MEKPLFIANDGTVVSKDMCFGPLARNLRLQAAGVWTNYWVPPCGPWTGVLPGQYLPIWCEYNQLVEKPRVNPTGPEEYVLKTDKKSF